MKNKCSICEIEMARMDSRKERIDGAIYQNLKTGKSFYICTVCSVWMEE